jgi:SAM-dependent methyltransferase
VRWRLAKLTRSRHAAASVTEAYREHVALLLKAYPRDVAMSLAVGGNYAAYGILLSQALRQLGLQPDQYLIDVGCGSGRLASVLKKTHRGRYLGIDVVPELLDYAREQCPADWRFQCAEGLQIPENDGVADMVCFFSVLTHLPHEQCYVYLREATRVLRPGGCVVASFLELGLPSHWSVFESTIGSIGRQTPPNVFIERSVFEVWGKHLGLKVERVLDGDKRVFALSEALVLDDGTPVEGSAALGQSCVVLRKT